VSDPRLLDPQPRSALQSLLSSLADNKYVLGRRYAEWCTGAPMLESAIAAAAMAQAELGHARWLYPLVASFADGAAPQPVEESGWAQRPTSALACLDGPFGSWHDFVATNFVIDTALTILLEAAGTSRFLPLSQRAGKVLQEEAAHWIHAEGWVRRLSAHPTTRALLVAALQRVWPHALAWFGARDDPVMTPLHAAAVLAAGSEELRDLLRTRLRPPLMAGGLVDEVDTPSIPWARWDPVTRRLSS
jgi:phenylacetate-CoA oxygenase PaaI subunit